MAIAALLAAEVGAQVGYGRRPSRPDTVAATRRAPPPAPELLEGFPRAGEPGLLPADSLLTGLFHPDSLAAGSTPDSIGAPGSPAAGLAPRAAVTRPETAASKAEPAAIPAGPPEEAHLVGPPPRRPLLDPDPDGKGRFGLWRWTPTNEAPARRARLAGCPRREIPSACLLPVRASRLVSDPDIDLDARTVRHTALVNGVSIGPSHPEDLGDYVHERILAARWREAAKESRALLGREVDPTSGILGGQGMTFQAPVSLGPAEAILGKGASITIRGQERISISGTSRWDANPPPGDISRQSKFPQLDLRQDLNIGVDGKVGDKVSIDWKENSNQDTPLANRIAIRYAGYEDEVIKGVDLGNTTLSLPGTQFVSYNGQHQGLFGIKTQSQFGDLGLTVIASKQEGQTASNRFVGYAQETQRQIFDLDYVQRRFFFLVDPVDPLLTGQLLGLDEGGMPPPVITDLQVWRDDRNQQNNGSTIPAVAYLDPTTPARPDSVSGQFDPLRNGEDYELRNDLYTVIVTAGSDQSLYRYPVLDLRSPVGSNEVLAATFTATYTFRTQQGQQQLVRRYGSPASPPPDTVRAKVLYVPDGQFTVFEDGGQFYSRADFWYPVRRLELRNIYNLGTTSVDPATLRLAVKKNAGADPLHFPDNVNATYLKGLGVDKTNRLGRPEPDEQIDEAFIKASLGLIVLPDLHPFAPAQEDSAWPFFRADRLASPAGRPAFFGGSESNRAVYDKRPSQLNPSLDRKYFFEVSYSTPQTQFVLSAPGTILEGSEAVVVNGQRLARGTGYSIDYESGIVNLIGQTDLPQNAQIAIDYAYAPLFALGQKTLMGFHAGWDPGTGGRRFGTTWLFESAGVAERRPKLGEEPARTIVGDLNGGFQSKPAFFNQLVDALPGVRPNADSRLDFAAEVGLSLPNPNTRGQVYIEDFEGAKDNSVLSVQREDWFWASIPDSIRQVSAQSRRGGLIWYNPVISPVKEGDLFPQLQPEEARDRKTVLTLEVNPRVAPDSLVDPTSWVGLTQGISSSGADFTRKQFIEIWINDFRDPAFRAAHPRLVLDLGVVSEDAQWHPTALPNGNRDTEDRNGDGILDRSENLFEDTGFDSTLSASEPGYSPQSNPDPNDDDFQFDREAADDVSAALNPRLFERVNRFEANTHLDDEDVNRDNYFKTANSSSFFEYSIDLGDTTYVATDVYEDFPDDPEVQGGSPDNGDNGWRLFRIPLEAGRAVGAPSLGSVQHLRIWLTGVPSTKLLQIATVDILGNLFKDDPLRDATGSPVNAVPGEVFKIRGINNKEEANEYVPPFELKEQNRITEREQSLAMDFVGLQPGHEGSAYRALANDRDFTLYRTLRWFVYGRGDGVTFAGQPGAGVEAFVRMGADTLNYYEYAVPVGEGWSEETIPLTELSGLKLEAQPPGREGTCASVDSCQVGLARIPCYERRRADGRLLRFVGCPSFTRVRRVAFGVRNVGDEKPSGTVWFDDLRLDDVIRDKGTATRLEFDTSFADFLSVSTNLLTRDEDFLSIGSGAQRGVSRGSGSKQRDFSLRSTVNLNKFFETSGVRIPFAFNYQRTTELPEFRPGNDVVLSPEQSQDEERGSLQRGYSANFSRQGAPAGVLKYTLDAFRADWSMNDRTNLSQARRDLGRTINVGLTYNVTPALKPLKLGKSELRYFPDNISLGARVNSSRSFSYDRDSLDLVSAVFQKDANLNGSASLSLLRSLRSSYRIDSRRDLTIENPARWLGGFNIGAEITRAQNVDLNWNPPVVRQVAPTLQFRGSSRDDHSPNLQLAGDPEQVRSLAASQTLSGAFNIPITLLIGQGGPGPPAPGDSTPGMIRRFKTQLGRVGRFRDVRVSLSANNSRDFSYATGVPRWLYQLGLSTHPGPDVELTDRGRATSSTSRTASLNSGFDFQLGITVNTSYAWSTREQEATFTTPRGGRTVTWPQVDLDWRSFQTKVPKLARVFRTLNLESRYTRDRSESGPVGNVSQNITERRDWNPIVGVNGTVGTGWTLRGRISSTGSIDDDNEAGLGRFTNSTRRQYQLNLSRRFDARSGIKFPWQKQPIKLKSDLTFNNDLSYSTDRSESGRRGQPATLNRDSSTASIRTGVTYNFRKNMDGDFSLNLGRNNNNKTGQKLRTITISGSIVFNF